MNIGEVPITTYLLTIDITLLLIIKYLLVGFCCTVVGIRIANKLILSIDADKNGCYMVWIFICTVFWPVVLICIVAYGLILSMGVIIIIVAQIIAFLISFLTGVNICTDKEKESS